MGLRFFMGRAGSGKTYRCLEEIKNELQALPKGAPLIYLVPEQMTHQSEQEILKHTQVDGFIRAQVFSFTRLAWKILQETGGVTRYHIDDVGIHMLLRKIIDNHKKDLKVFRKASEQHGFYDQISTMLKELKSYAITPEQLMEMKETMLQIHGEQNKAVLLNKLEDIKIIFEEFEKALLHTYVDSEDYLRLLEEKIPQSTYLKGATIYVDGFYTLAPQERKALAQLMKHCKDVTVTITTNQDEPSFVDGMSLFSPTMKFYGQIRKLGMELELEQEVVVIDGEEGRFSQSDSLAHLEAYYDARPVKSYYGDTDVQFIVAVNRRAEVEGIAREIRQIVREQGIRYRDIALLLRNGHIYHDFIRTIFTDYDIPFFLDDKRPMHYHPLVECIRSSIEVIKDYYRYDAVFRCIKTELLFPLGSKPSLRDDMDVLENYCLAYGIQGKKWHKPFTYSRYRTLDHIQKVKTDEELNREKKLNKLREMVVGPLESLGKKLKKAKTGLEYCQGLYSYLEEIQAFEKLEKLRIEAEEKGELLEVRDHEMVWQAVMDLLDQYVEILGDEEVSLADFLHILETGLDTLKFANIPSSLDAVMIGDAEQSRLANTKCVFLMGVNEGVIPKIPEENGMIDEKERELLMQYGVELAPTATQQLMDEQFAIYHMLTRSSSRLYICYPMADEEGQTLTPSYIIKRLQDMFPNAESHFITNDVNDIGGEKEFSFISSLEPTLSYLTQKLQVWKKYPRDTQMDIWWDVYNIYMDDKEWQQKGKKIISSLFYENKGKKLSHDVSRKLYGKHIKGSVSRMESFNRCGYQHFANYGLGLRERDVYQLEAPDIGTLFHGALKYMTDALVEREKTWKDVSKEELAHLSKNAVEALAPVVQREILLSSSRFLYMKRKLQKVIEKTSFVLHEHSKESSFVPIAMEQDFGEKSSLPPLNFQLPNGVEMELVGKIDRVDRADCPAGTFLRIVDYKSSDRKLDLSEVYYGLALQMLAYLDVVVSNAPMWLGTEVSPAGVLYFHVHNPMLKVDKPVDIMDVESMIRKEYKMKGLVLRDTEVARLMDAALAEGSRSDIISVGLKKDGDFLANSSVASKDEFSLLQQYVRETIKDAGVAITDGAIDIAPYKMKSNTPCGFCAFKSVCQFDYSLEENNYRILGDLKQKDALEKMREEADHDHS